MMEPYAGFEPQVGEIRALRTFRIGPNGLLYPLFTDAAWSAGTNTARCNLGGAHASPEPDCTCGYYAYASDSAAGEYPNAHHVLAVVACWGRVIAGTRGIRAEHARVEAVWMSEKVPTELADTVAECYPAAAVYTDKQLMLTEHPPTQLDCYELADSGRATRRRGVRVAVVAAIGLGLLPHTWLAGNLDLLVAWLLELTGFLIAATYSYRRHGVAAKRRAMQSFALVLWLLSPFGGAAGTFLLRVPMMQLAFLIMAQRRALSLEASRFPARIATLGPRDDRPPPR
jgi:hypothetical protein